MSKDVELIEIEEGDESFEVAPGIGFGDLLKYAKYLEAAKKLADIALAGEGGFDLKIGHLRKHVEITNLPAP